MFGLVSKAGAYADIVVAAEVRHSACVPDEALDDEELGRPFCHFGYVGASHASGLLEAGIDQEGLIFEIV